MENGERGCGYHGLAMGRDGTTVRMPASEYGGGVQQDG
ncbi:hypothetical protein [Pseudomonas sp. GW704-F3]